MSLKKTTLDTFVRLGGYDIVKRKKGKWKNISEASKRTGLSRPTIYILLAKYPIRPSKTVPKYVEEFHDCEGFRRLKEQFEHTISKSSYRQTISTVMKAWKLLQKKDMISWDENDFTKIWNHESFIDKKAKGFEFGYSVALRRLMRAIGRHDLLPKFKGKKRPAGAKKEWFLHDEEIISLLAHIRTPDALLYFYSGLMGFGRSSALIGKRDEGISIGISPQDIDFEDKTLTVFEPKTRQYVKKYPPLCYFDLLKRYVEDHKIEPDKPIFPKAYAFYNTQLREAGKKAGLKRKVSTHIMKHTFVSQAHRHRVSRETVVEITGTEDRTLKAYYLSVEEKRVRNEMQGLEWDAIPFPEWVKTCLHPYFKGRYNEMRSEQVSLPAT